MIVLDDLLLVELLGRGVGHDQDAVDSSITGASASAIPLESMPTRKCRALPADLAAIDTLDLAVPVCRGRVRAGLGPGGLLGFVGLLGDFGWHVAALRLTRRQKHGEREQGEQREGTSARRGHHGNPLPWLQLLSAYEASQPSSRPSVKGLSMDLCGCDDLRHPGRCRWKTRSVDGADET